MNRVAFTIFGLDIMWYGVLMASAMILCVLLALKEGKRVNISEDDILNLAIVSIPCGLIGGILAGFIYTKIKKINFFKMADTVMIGIPLGQAIGRWGNYINGEAHGGPTSLPWGIMVNGVKVHPTFLYESIWDLAIFIFIWSFRKKKKYEGQLAIYYLILYSLGRFFIEGLRTDSLMIGPLRMAQVISLITIIVCLILHKILSKRNKEAN